MRDTLYGTKVLTKTNHEKVIAERSYFGDFDLLFRAVKLNFKFVEIPIRYRNRTYGANQISQLAHGWLLLKMTAFAVRRIKFLS